MRGPVRDPRLRLATVQLQIGWLEAAIEMRAQPAWPTFVEKIKSARSDHLEALAIADDADLRFEQGIIYLATSLLAIAQAGPTALESLRFEEAGLQNEVRSLQDAGLLPTNGKQGART